MGAAGEQHPRGYIGWQFGRLLILTDGAGECAQRTLLEKELPNLLSPEVVVEHLSVLGASDGEEAVPAPAVLLLLPYPGHVPGPNHFRPG